VKLHEFRVPTADGLSEISSQPTAIICFSHLRWGFVWQRPQHLLTRLADTCPVYVVEEPRQGEPDEAASLRITIDRGVTVLTPIFPAADDFRSDFHGAANVVIRDLLEDYFAVTDAGARPVIWYYTPMALGAEPSKALGKAVVVFDAMDELAQFRGAPKTLIAQEQALIAQADLVFAGGPRLYERRKDRHPRVHCFPSGVEASHFRQPGQTPSHLPQCPAPIIGYYGVLDERIDFDLIAAIADARPDWSIVLIGPFAKIDPDTLPQRANLHYPGQLDYADLPAALATFDVAIMPFAQNEATEFISPTKTLEYLAGGKPVVSTPIRDVVLLYGEFVSVADCAELFIDAIDQALKGVPVADSTDVDDLLRQHDWDAIAGQMQALIADRVRAKAPRGVLTTAAD